MGLKIDFLIYLKISKGKLVFNTKRYRLTDNHFKTTLTIDFELQQRNDNGIKISPYPEHLLIYSFYGKLLKNDIGKSY